MGSTGLDGLYAIHGRTHLFYKRPTMCGAFFFWVGPPENGFGFPIDFPLQANKELFCGWHPLKRKGKPPKQGYPQKRHTHVALGIDEV